jgi:hypothetical protein
MRFKEVQKIDLITNWFKCPDPIGLARLLPGCSVLIPIAKAVPKGFDRINVLVLGNN